MTRRFSLRRFSLRSYFERHPALALGLCCVAMIWLAVLSVQGLIRARGTVRADWPLAGHFKAQR